MPELPEVECARRLLEAQCVGKKIVFVNAADDPKVFEGATPSDISAILLNQAPIAARRLGKHCWLDFGPSAPALLLHLGMTGGTVVRGKGSAHYQRYSIDESQWPPKYLKLELHFADGTQWAFCDSRRFARIRLLNDPLIIPPLSQLGWDPLLSWPSLADFTTALAAQRRAIKALLLDQSFSAGVGNWVADEVLYQCRIHPEQPANSLTAEHAQQLHKWIVEVCRIASEVNADADKLPESWLFHHRWGKGSGKIAKIEGHVIDHITVGGRTSAYVPALQKLSKAVGTSATKVAKKVAAGEKTEVGQGSKKKVGNGKKVGVKRELDAAEGDEEKVENKGKKRQAGGKKAVKSATPSGNDTVDVVPETAAVVAEGLATSSAAVKGAEKAPRRPSVAIEIRGGDKRRPVKASSAPRKKPMKQPVAVSGPTTRGAALSLLKGL